MADGNSQTRIMRKPCRIVPGTKSVGRELLASKRRNEFVGMPNMPNQWNELWSMPNTYKMLQSLILAGDLEMAQEQVDT